MSQIFDPRGTIPTLVFMGEVGGKCPTVATTHWLSLGRVLKWLVRHRAKVMNYLDLENPSCRPSVSWWIVSLLMQGVTAKVDVLFKSLQAKQLLIRQQLSLLDDFVSRLKELASVIGPLSDAQIGAFGTDDRPRFMSPVNAGSVFGISIDNIVAFVKGQGPFSMVEYAKLYAESAASLVDSFGDMFVELASGVSKIQPQRDDSNVGIHDTPLSCLPFSF